MSPETKRHVKMGTVVDKDVFSGNEICTSSLFHLTIVGWLGLEVDETYAFVGDALYSRFRDGYYVFNSQLVKDEITILKKLKTPYLSVSHFTGMIHRRDEVIAELEELYHHRDKNSS